MRREISSAVFLCLIDVLLVLEVLLLVALLLAVLILLVAEGGVKE